MITRTRWKEGFTIIISSGCVCPRKIFPPTSFPPGREIIFPIPSSLQPFDQSCDLKDVAVRRFGAAGGVSLAPRPRVVHRDSLEPLCHSTSSGSLNNGSLRLISPVGVVDPFRVDGSIWKPYVFRLVRFRRFLGIKGTTTILRIRPQRTAYGFPRGFNGIIYNGYVSRPCAGLGRVFSAVCRTRTCILGRVQDSGVYSRPCAGLGSCRREQFTAFSSVCRTRTPPARLVLAL